jgi:hypothetical protein
MHDARPWPLVESNGFVLGVRITGTGMYVALNRMRAVTDGMVLVKDIE